MSMKIGNSRDFTSGQHSANIRRVDDVGTLHRELKRFLLNQIMKDGITQLPIEIMFTEMGEIVRIYFGDNNVLFTSDMQVLADMCREAAVILREDLS